MGFPSGCCHRDILHEGATPAVQQTQPAVQGRKCEGNKSYKTVLHGKRKLKTQQTLSHVSASRSKCIKYFSKESVYLFQVTKSKLLFSQLDRNRCTRFLLLQRTLQCLVITKNSPEVCKFNLWLNMHAASQLLCTSLGIHEACSVKYFSFLLCLVN